MASDSHQTLVPPPDLGPSYKESSSLAQATRRLSMRPGTGMSHRDFTTDPHSALIQEHNHVHRSAKSRRVQEAAPSDSHSEPDDSNIFLPSSSKHSQKMISPFLTKHIPQQYNPLGQGGQPQPPTTSDKSSTKYCYRHRPDLKCRRQVDEPSMEQLQSELATLSQADQQAVSHVWSLFSAAPSKHRQLMLQGILAQCCFPQLSFVSASVKNLIKIDFLSALPPELGFKILCYLDTASLCRAAQVSQRWRAMADDDVVWHRMCEQHIDRKCTKCGWGLPLLEQKRLRAEKRQVQLRAAGKGLNEWSPNITPQPESPSDQEVSTSVSTERVQDDSTESSSGSKRPLPEDPASPEPAAKRPCGQAPTSQPERAERRKRPWKDVYKDRFKVGTNWKYGRCSMKVFKGHTNGIMCLQFDDSILATGSYDTTIKIWDVETGEELRTLTGHTAGIRCLQFDDTCLFSGSIDRTLKVWNWRTGECIKTFTGPSAGIIGLHYSDKILACGSMDNTIRIWNMKDKSTFLLRGHSDWVNAVRIDSRSRTLFSASDDCTVRLWDLDTRQCLKIFKGHAGQVQQVVLLPHEFELGDDDDDYLSQFPGHDSDPEQSDTGMASPDACRSSFGLASLRSSGSPGPSNKPSPPRYMLTGALDNTIRLWHIPSGRCIRTFFGHVEGIWALAADTLRVVSGAEDRMVKVWDPRTGACERTFTGHVGPVTCVGLSDSRFATGSEDCEVRMYSFEGDSGSSMGQTGETTLSTEADDGSVTP